MATPLEMWEDRVRQCEAELRATNAALARAENRKAELEREINEYEGETEAETDDGGFVIKKNRGRRENDERRELLESLEVLEKSAEGLAVRCTEAVQQKEKTEEEYTRELDIYEGLHEMVKKIIAMETQVKEEEEGKRENPEKKLHQESKEWAEEEKDMRKNLMGTQEFLKQKRKQQQSELGALQKEVEKLEYMQNEAREKRKKESKKMIASDEGRSDKRNDEAMIHHVNNPLNMNSFEFAGSIAQQMSSLKEKSSGRVSRSSAPGLSTRTSGLKSCIKGASSAFKDPSQDGNHNHNLVNVATPSFNTLSAPVSRAASQALTDKQESFADYPISSNLGSKPTGSSSVSREYHRMLMNHQLQQRARSYTTMELSKKIASRKRDLFGDVTNNQ